MKNQNSHTEESDKTVKTEVLVESDTSWNGDPIPPYLPGRPRVTITKITVPPHTKSEWHKHSITHAGIILKGELVVHDDLGREVRLKEGDAVIETINRLHFGWNDTDKETVIYAFYASVNGVDNSE